jgi:outer membrane protein assembly factor BamB
MKLNKLIVIVAILSFALLTSAILAQPDYMQRSSMARPTVTQSATDPVDWWPMFHHDLNHTGYSTSTAPKTNNIAWNYTTGYVVDSSPAVADGVVYIGSQDYNVYCLNASTGAHIWNYTTGYPVESSPAVADGMVYVGSQDHNIYCLNASTGTQIWNYTTGGLVDSSPAVAAGMVYIGSDDFRVYCLNASTGTQIWNYTIGYGYPVESSPAVAAGMVYIGSNTNNVYCLNASTGTQIWNYTTSGLVDSSPAVAAGMVYIGSDDHNVYCLNASTGTQIWNYTTGGVVHSCPAVAAGMVYVGSWDFRVYCLNASTGTQIWNYTTGYVVFSSPAVAAGMVYIGSKDSEVYAFGDVHDVAATDVTVKAVVGQGMIATIMVTVVNQGNFTETFNLTACYNATPILNERWLPDTPSSTFYGMGDADRDGYIDVWDTIIISSQMGWNGPPGQNPADINLDGKVDTQDVLTAGKNVGKDIWTVLGLPKLIEDHEVVVLPPGFWAIMAFRWNTTGVAKGNYTISAHATPVPGETNTTNNNYTDGWTIVSIVGDVTGANGVPDGQVNLMDVYKVAMQFGSSAPTWNPYWGPVCDINNDGTVNLIDYYRTCMNFGQSDP